MAKRGPVAKYVVRLSSDERLRLEDMIGTGRDAAYRLLKARILLKADVSMQSGGWDDARIAEALETSASTVFRARRQLVEEGLEATLARKKQKAPSTSAIFDGEAERSSLHWPVQNRPRAMPVGLCGCWKSAWLHSASSRRRATVQSTGCSKKRA